MSSLPRQDAAPRAERDGCDCPPQIMRCVHFDGRILCLAGTNSLNHWPYSVGFTHGPPTAICHDCGMHVWRRDAVDRIGNFDDLPAALTAFEAAEARLLAGDAL